jgi:CheY-like chemotaxis protein
MTLEKKLSIGGKVHLHIVMDNKPIRNLYAQALRRRGYLVSEFPNPKDEKKHAENAHIIIADRGTETRKNGYKLAEFINKKYFDKKPVILMEAMPAEKDFKREKYLAGKFKWDLEIDQFSDELGKIVERFYSMNVFVVGEPDWALKTRQTIVEEMPFIYNDLESAINNMERSRGMIIGHPVARYHKMNSEKVSACAALDILQKEGYKGIVHFYELSEKVDKEEITKVIQKMA